MVDFQSRDTRRGSSTNDEPAEESTNDEPAEESTNDEPAEESAADDEDRTDRDAPTEGASDRTGLAVLTVDVDEAARSAGETVIERLEADGRAVVGTERVEAGYDAVQTAIDRTVPGRDTDAIVTVGATGVGTADVTVEAVTPLLDKQLPGFGELFRVSYHEQVGTDVVGMRPIAGISDGVPVFCLPGDPEAAAFATGEVLLETVDELVSKASQ